MGSYTWVGEYNAVAGDVDAASAAPTPRRSKRLHRSKKLEFLGWGSKPLVEFLDSIGRDTSHQISQYDVASIIADYVNQRKLLHPTKKKRIVCDERLHSLFGRKSIARIKIYDLLQQHFADNLEDDSSDSDSDSNDDVLDDEDEEPAASHRQQRKKHKRRVALEAPPPVPKSCFAAVIPENVKLVYLRRSVVEALLKQDEAQVFEDKVVGSFVRTKSDPNDYLQKNSHQLLQVKAILKKPNSESSDGGVLLQLYGAIKDFPISMLSDDNFSKEECDDLCERIKGGLLRRPTVVELQQKVHILHEDVTKHWLVRELTYLQNLIDRANEKGWRRELFEHLERRQLLQSPEEQARLLREVPEVIADELEVEAKDSPDEIEQGNLGSPGHILRGASTPICDIPVEGTRITWTSEACEDGDSLQDWQKQPTESVKQILDETNNGIVEDNKASQQLMDKHVVMTQVVDLSDDDESEELGTDRKDEIPIEQLGSLLWHYFDPQGNIQGPFSIISLKRWSDSDYFPPDFKIWKTGQSSGEAVLLTDILRRNFPNKSAYQ